MLHLDPSGFQITGYNGAIALTGPSLEFAKTDLPQPHITLLSAGEYKSLGRPPLSDISIPLDHVYVLGEGGKGDVRWSVVAWNRADVWRRSKGLGKKEYHLTLSKTDDHAASKGIGSLHKSVEELVVEAEKLGLGGMDHVVVACGPELHHIARAISESMIASFSDSYKGYIRFAETLSDVDPKLAMLAYVQAAAIQPALAARVIVKLKKLSELCSCGPNITSSELDRIPNIIRPHLLRPWPESMFESLASTLWTYPTTSRERQIYLGAELPRFFSFVYPGRIAGMSTPRNETDIDTLGSMGFTHVLTLTKETPLPATWFEGKEIRNVYVPVENWEAPTLEEMDVIYGMIRDGGVWLVHCGGGVGRAGTVLACLITMVGLGTEDGGDRPRLDAQTTITLLRKARPRSLESETQEKFVSAWVSHRWKRLNHTVLEEPYTSLQIRHAAQNNLHDLSIPSVYFLIGKPGSGKSWLSSAIAKRRPREKTIIISQDESGSRSMCETQLSREYPADVLVILDRCNPSREDRKIWLGLTSRRVIAVYFDYPKELCRQRINARLDHPTIRAGRGGNALDQMDRQNIPPNLTEGFASVVNISSFAAAKEAVRILSPDLPPLKFPRTPHLLNLGATTDDDLVNDDFELLSGNLTVEEKIDGANMGISLAYDGSIRVQNRSHWVSSADHAQFKPLDKWIEAHSAALREILDRDEQYPERFILYGEWMVAKHSIHYDALPDRFIVFDLYDRYENIFLSRLALTRMISGKGLHQVPLLVETGELTKKDVMDMLQMKSAYSSERVEGVYIRFEDERRRRTIGRGKIVRGDFIAGNEHWSKGRITLNGIADHMCS